MEQTTSEAMPAETPVKRPTFLTVLCILSFVGTGFGVLGGLYSLFFSDAMNMMAQQSMMEGMEGMEAMPGMEEAMNAMKYAKIIGIVGVIANLICLAGVLMMWNLKKTGYYIYVVAEIAPPILSIALMGMGSLFGGAMAMLGSIFPLAFIIMYGLNLKHMK